MGVLQPTYANAIANHFLRGVSFATPFPSFTSYIGLFKGGVEVSGGGYARQLSSTYFGFQSSGIIKNTVEIVWPEASGDWGNDISHWGIASASSGGTVCALVPFDTDQVVLTGTILRIPINSLQVSINATAYMAQQVLHHLFGKAALPTSPSTRRLAIKSGNFELSGNGYSRQNPTFAAPANGICANSGIVNFSNASAIWASFNRFVMLDSATALQGNELFSYAISPVGLNKGDNIRIPVGSLLAGVT